MESTSQRVLPADSDYHYAVLMSVNFEHAYYNASNLVCPGLKFYPTEASKQLMYSLGFIYQAEANGFSVLYNANRPHKLLQYLHTQEENLAAAYAQWDQPYPIPSSSKGLWTSLSFMVCVENPFFVNVTAMPVDTRPERKAYYFSNTSPVSTTSNRGRRATLSTGPLTKAKEIDVTGSQYALTIASQEVIQVVLYDAGGQPVLIYGPIFPLRPPYLPADDPVSPTPEPVPLYPTAYIDLSGLPEGKYTVEQFEKLEFQSPYSLVSPDDVPPISSNEILYMYSAPSPMFFIDLAFADPLVIFAPPTAQAVSTGVYPVRPFSFMHTFSDALPDDPVVSVEYTVRFGNRPTTWNYYVVSTGHPLSDLGISCPDPKSPQVSFSKPKKVTLSNGQIAWHMASDQAIPLQQRSLYNFQLTGKVGGLRTKNGVLINRMPVASGDQIIPQQSNFATGQSAPPLSSSAGSSKKQVLKHLTSNYSDIYVYL